MVNAARASLVPPNRPEGKYRSLHVDRVQMDGDLSLKANADSRIDAAAFRQCYRDGIRDRVERRRQAGPPVPETVNMTPSDTVDGPTRD